MIRVIHEEWRSVGIYHGIDYTGYYEVSNLGRVRSIDRYVNNNGTLVFVKGHICPTWVAAKYEKVVLRKNNTRKNVSVHRLVAFAFVRNDDPINKTEINHIDENKLNNRWDNLEWCTRAYNQKYYANRHNPRTIVYCKYCGKEMSKSSKGNVCASCFKLLYTKHSKLFCKNCGCEITNKSKSGYCRNCFYKILSINKSDSFNMCPICGNKTHNSKYCSYNCASIANRKTIWPTKEELKNLIRTMSFLQIGKQFGVTDNAVRKWCKQYNLPYKASEIKKYTDEEWEKI